MSDQLYYIVCSKDFVGNSIVFWRAGGKGYTINLAEAGKYTEKKAIPICQNRGTDIAYPVEVLDKVARRHVDGQDLYKIRDQQLNTE